MKIEPQIPINYNGLAIIGEAGGEKEEELGQPFVGKAGKLLDQVLDGIGVERNRCLISNVFLERPEDNKVDVFFRSYDRDNYQDRVFIEQYSKYRNTKVVKEEYRHHMERLDTELVLYPPKIILLLGATALWRMLQLEGITDARGKWAFKETPNTIIGILPTWHPSAVLRDRGNKLPEFISDLLEVKQVLHILETDYIGEK
jgi:uracil-DNA glycosylase